MNGTGVNAASMAFNKALIERAMSAELCLPSDGQRPITSDQVLWASEFDSDMKFAKAESGRRAFAQQV
jgi:hypothetical protein